MKADTASHIRQPQPGTHATPNLFGEFAARWLASWRRGVQTHGHIDEATGLCNQAGLESRGNDLLATCLRDGRAISVIVFDLSDLLEVRAIYGNHIAREATAGVVRKLTALAGRGGVAARTGQVEFTLVLPRLGREKALARMHRVLGGPPRIECDAGGEEIVLVPDFLIESADAATQSVCELQQDLRRDMARQQAHEQRRQLHMQRKRERHSRPMGLVTLPRAAQAA